MLHNSKAKTILITNSIKLLFQNRKGHLSAMDVAQQLYKAPSEILTPQPSETITPQPSETMTPQPSVTMTTKPTVTMTTQQPPPSVETFSAWDQDPDIMQPRSDIKIIPINSVSIILNSDSSIHYSCYNSQDEVIIRTKILLV